MIPADVPGHVITPQVETEGVHADSQPTSQGLVPPVSPSGNSRTAALEAIIIQMSLKEEARCFLLRVGKKPHSNPQTQGGMF